MDLAPQIGRHFIPLLTKGLLRRIGQVIGHIADLHLLLTPGVFRRMLLRFPLHALDFPLGKPARCGDGDPLLLPGALIASPHAEDAVGIYIKAHLDLGHSPRGGEDSIEHEASQSAVAGRHRPLALQHVNLHARLVIGGSGEYLALACRDGGVA
ncbi:MAG: hypothetical protein DDT27_01423 [Dehalococcoidia bacterium]|nr:hypothetical protein [Chloroflexota bacterium]